MVPYFPDAIQSWDVSVLNWIQNNIASPFLDFFFKYVTYFGEGGIFWIAIAFIFLFFKKTRRTGIMMGVALIIGLVFVNGVIKHIFLRVRPYDLENALICGKQLLINIQPDTSFPSGHSLACFECSTVLMYKNKKIGIPALIIAIAVAFSRVYLYVHFPTDVICGAILGVLNGFLGIVITNAVLEILKNKKGISID